MANDYRVNHQVVNSVSFLVHSIHVLKKVLALLKDKPFPKMGFTHFSQLGISEKFTFKLTHLEHYSSLTITDNSNQLQALTGKHCTSNYES